MPRAPPVTTATLPLSERGVLDMASIMATHSALSLVLCSGSQERAVRQIGAERPDVTAEEHRPAIGSQLEPGVTALLDRPLLGGGEPFGRGLALRGTEERGAQELACAALIKRSQQSEAA